MLKMDMTIQGAEVPQEARVLTSELLDGKTSACSVGGIFLFAPLFCPSYRTAGPSQNRRPGISAGFQTNPPSAIFPLFSGFGTQHI